MKKYVYSALAVVLVAFGIYGYKLIWGKPFNIDHMFERFVLQLMLKEPELLTYIGLIDNTRLDFHSHRLTDSSPQHLYDRHKLFTRYAKLTRSYNPKYLTLQQQLSREIALAFIETEIRRKPWLFHDFPVNQMRGPQTGLPTFMTVNHRLENRKSAENYISRLQAFEEKFQQISESVQYRKDRGVIPPLFVVEAVIRDIEAVISTVPAENIMYTHFLEKLAEMDDVDAMRSSELASRALRAIESEVMNGYQLLLETFEELREIAPVEIGAWNLPDGENYYRFEIESHTTLRMEADELHQIGLREVERLTQEAFERFNEIGIRSGTIAERFARLDERPGMFYPDEYDIHDRIIADYSAINDSLITLVEPLFSKTPSAPMEVRRVPPHSEEGAPFAYYQIPPLDGSGPGIFFINLKNPEEIQRYGMKTLTAHEGIPGHHFQLALQQELEGLPTLRKLMPVIAFIEGWALYAEQLVAEAGFYENDPYGDLGRLQAALFRAARLVVDTGIHHKRWSMEESVEYMITNTGYPVSLMQSEVERYAVWPGQALSYKIGMLHFLELREYAMDALGDRFNLSEFHDIVLLNGAMPLPILTEVVEFWVEHVK